MRGMTANAGGESEPQGRVLDALAVIAGALTLLGGVAWLVLAPGADTSSADALASRFQVAWAVWVVAVGISALGMFRLSFSLWVPSGVADPPSAVTLLGMAVVLVGGSFVGVTAPIDNMTLYQASDPRHQPATVLAEILGFAYFSAFPAVVVAALLILRPWRRREGARRDAGGTGALGKGN